MKSDKALTKREREVMDQVVGGKRNREIAKELYIAVPTVERHLHNIYQKLGVTTRTQATVWYLGDGRSK